MIGLVFQAALLWFLITLFTRQTNSQQSQTEMIIGFIAGAFMTNLLLGSILGIFTILIHVTILYILVDKVCGTAKKTTIRICVWYFSVIFALHLTLTLLTGG